MEDQQQPTPDQIVINQLALGKAQVEVDLLYAKAEIQLLRQQLAEAQGAHDVS